MAIPCCNPCVTCEPSVASGAFGLNPQTTDPNNPFLNTSSAAPDANLFGRQTYIPPGQPPIGSVWYAPFCGTFCFSTASQADADACADRRKMECISNNWPVTIPNPNPGSQPPGFPPPTPTVQVPRNIFQNSPQSCETECPDGDTFSYTVPAGAITDISQATANARAQVVACEQAAARRICLGDMNAAATCAGQAFNDSFSVEHSGASFSASISEGSLPPGVSMFTNSDFVNFTGTPTAGGEYNFTVTITDNLGNANHKSYSIVVLQISPTSLPAGTIGNAYSQSMTLLGASGAVTWGASNLPTGLTINSSSGLISGTPTGSSGSNLVTITATSGDGSCSEDYTLTINGGVDWSQLVWNVIIHSDANGGTSSGFPNSGLTGSAFNVDASAPFDAVLNVSARIVISGTMMYSGPAINAQINGAVLVNNLIGGQGGSTFLQFSWFKGGAFQAQIGGSDPAVGALNLPISSVAIGAPVQLRIDIDVRATDGGALQSNPVQCSGSGTIVNL